MNISDLLKRFVLWVFGQSKQLKDSRVVNGREYKLPGLTLQKLRRDSDRSVCTWSVLRYSDSKDPLHDNGYNLEITCDTLEYVAGAEPVRKTNRLSTHLVIIIKVYYKIFIDPKTKRRTIRKEKILFKEAIFKRAYTEDRRDQAEEIIDKTVMLLRLQHKFHPDTFPWEEAIRQCAQVMLQSPTHDCFPD